MRAAAALALALALAACAATPPPSASPDEAAAELVVGAYVDAFNRGDFRGAAALMDPDELEQFVDLVGMMMALPDAPTDAGAVPTDGPDAFVWFLGTMDRLAPGMTDAMRSAEGDVIGSVAEGDSLVHVVLRTRASVMGIDAETVSTTTTRRRDGRWTVALSGDLGTLAQTIRRMVPVPEADPLDDGGKAPLKPGRDG